MKKIIALVVMAGIITGMLTAYAKNSKRESETASSITVDQITATPSNYLGKIVSVAGTVTKIDAADTSGRKFVITVDGTLDVFVTAMQLNPASGKVVLDRSVRDAYSLRNGEKPTKGTSKDRAEAFALKTIIFAVGDPMIVAGSIRQSGRRLSIPSVLALKTRMVSHYEPPEEIRIINQ